MRRYGCKGDFPALRGYQTENGQLMLCIGCADKYERMSERKYNMHAQEMNYLADAMDTVMGVPGITPRYKPIANAPNNVHIGDINIHDSQIGVLNTGHISSLNSSLQFISKQGDKELAELLKALSELVVNSAETEASARNEILEKLKFLSEQAAKSSDKRDRSIGKMVLESMTSLLQQIPNAIECWQKLQPLFENLF